MKKAMQTNQWCDLCLEIQYGINKSTRRLQRTSSTVEKPTNIVTHCIFQGFVKSKLSIICIHFLIKDHFQHLITVLTSQKTRLRQPS